MYFLPTIKQITVTDCFHHQKNKIKVSSATPWLSNMIGRGMIVAYTKSGPGPAVFKWPPILKPPCVFKHSQRTSGECL